MNFAEKLRRLTENENKAKLSRSAGLPPNAINDYIKKGYTPRADNALELARQLKVPLEWLIDSKMDWPPPDTQTASPSQLSDRNLMLEVAKRYRAGITAVLDGLDQIEREDWEQINKMLSAHWRDGEPMPIEAQRLVPMLQAINSASDAQLRYSLPYFSMANHKLMPGSDRPVSDFDPARFDERFRNLNENKAFMAVIRRILSAVQSQKLVMPKPVEFGDGSEWAQRPYPGVASSASTAPPSPPPTPAGAESTTPTSRPPPAHHPYPPKMKPVDLGSQRMRSKSRKSEPIRRPHSG